MSQKILLIEDNPISRKMVRVALETEGFQVFEAGEGAAGLSLMSEKKPDLVLQDLLLPDVNGFDLVWQLRERRPGENIPILALTGLMGKSEATRVADAAFTDYLFKPVEPSQLVRIVRSHLPAPSAQDQSGKSRTVLLVDDDAVQLKLLATYLSHLDFTVVTATDARDGLAKARVHRPDAIVSDVLMPGWDGFQLCMKIREDASLAGIPVVLRSNLYDHEGDKELARKVGAYALLPTTPDFRDVIQALSECLETPSRPLAADPAALQAAHEERLAFQLGRQAKLSAELAQRCATQSAQLSVLAGIGEIFVKGASSDEDLLNDILARCLDAIGCSCGAIYLADGDGGLNLSAHLGFSEPAVRSLGSFFGCKNLLLDAMKQREPVAIPLSASYDQALIRSLSDLRAESLLACPLRFGGEPLGVLALVSIRRAPDDDKMSFARAITNEIGEVVALKRSISRLQYMAAYDSLTGLANRAQLCARLEEVKNNGDHAALYLLNLDHFQEINNTLGFQNGNEMLRLVARRLEEKFRDRALVARLGADEFAVMIGGKTDAAGAGRQAAEILKCLDSSFRLDGLPVAARATLGVAFMPEHGDDAETVLSRADMAQRAARRTGHDYLVYPQSVESYDPDRLALLGELREAVERDIFVLHYQPKVAYRSRRCVGVESLLRWPHPRRGWVPPDQFISLAERAGLIRPVTVWVLSQALQQARLWRQTGLEFGIAVNVSARDVLDPGFPDLVLRACAAAGAGPEILTLELTETAIMSDPVKTAAAFQRLSDDGIRLSIDDFGTGYSSFSYLQKLPVNEIKIDKSFVLRLLSDRRSEAIVRSIIALGNNLGLAVVAEGVENAEIWQRLAEFGCDLSQGYHLCRPLPARDLVTALRTPSWGRPRHDSSDIQEL
jgi:diguanylate cyclase (GGDEF)-like protein